MEREIFRIRLKHKSDHLSLLFQRFFKKFDLMKHCVKNVRSRCYAGLYFPAFILNTERCSVSFCIQSGCGKTRTRITPDTSTFYVVKVKIEIGWIINDYSWVTSVLLFTLSVLSWLLISAAIRMEKILESRRYLYYLLVNQQFWRH